MSLCCAYVAFNCFFFLWIALTVSTYIFVSCITFTSYVAQCCGTSVGQNASFDVGKGWNAVKEFGNGGNSCNGGCGGGGGDRRDETEYPGPEYSYDNEDTVVGMSLIVMSVCALLIFNTLPEYIFRKRINLGGGYKSIVVKKECGCTVVYNPSEKPSCSSLGYYHE